MRTKALKISQFCKAELEAGITSPTQIKQDYENKYPQLPAKTLECYIMALKRMGIDKTAKEGIIKAERKKQAEKDIEDYQNVKDYIANAENGGVQQSQIQSQLKNMRKLWLIMDKSDPQTWTLQNLLEAIEMKGGYAKVLNEKDQKVWKQPAAVKNLLSPFSTMWQGKLPKNWSANLCVHKAGELKDFWLFNELDEFLSKLTDTEEMSIEGWQAIFRAHINMGCREGTEGNTGIIGLLWQDIDFNTKRCSLREKGHRGNAGERWNNVPLDMFPFLEGWNYLMQWHKQQGQPRIGKVFPIRYSQYNAMFHATRQKCQSRIKEDSDTQRLHIHRRNHGQYAKRMRIPLELICGTAPNGRFGVGWKDPKIPVLYYLSEEAEEIDPTELEYMRSTPKYHKILKNMMLSNIEVKQLLGMLPADKEPQELLKKAFEELHFNAIPQNPEILPTLQIQTPQRDQTQANF